ncbi:MAG: Uma2 family endonuclease [Bradymonadaceae bacterium]
MATTPEPPADDRHWTVDDYMQLDDDRRWEVLEGELVMVPSPNIHHQRSVTRFGTLLDQHVTEHDLGACFDAPFDVVLDRDTVLQPDFTFVRADRLEELYDGHCITGPPDMVVEILSESTASRDRTQKHRLYGEYGVEWLLFIEPEEHWVEVFRLRDDEYTLEVEAEDDETLEFGLFPDLAVDLADVWFEMPGASG